MSSSSRVLKYRGQSGKSQGVLRVSSGTTRCVVMDESLATRRLRRRGSMIPASFRPPLETRSNSRTQICRAEAHAHPFGSLRRILPAMRLAFGDFVFDSDTRELLRGGDRVTLSPKAFQLLETLIENRPRALSKSVLHDRLWPKTFVVEANLSNLVGEIRHALGEDSRTARFVRTVHRFGYALQYVATNPEHRLQTDDELGSHLVGSSAPPLPLGHDRNSPDNLPQPLTRFVGRQREIAAVRSLVSQTRLTTLCGPAGIGKTRLALEVARDSVDEYADGVWLVE